MPTKNPVDVADPAATPDPAETPETVKETPAQRRKRERAEFQARLNELDAQDQAEGTDVPEPTHRLTLSNGEQVDVAHGGMVTHHSTKDGVFRVLACDALNGDR